jgi:hypothetical protein
MHDFNATNTWKDLMNQINCKEINKIIAGKSKLVPKKVVFRRPLFKTKDSDSTTISTTE